MPVLNKSTLAAQWGEFAAQENVDLVVCVASALKRGIVDSDESRRYNKPSGNLASGFNLSGLGQWIDACINADRVLTLWLMMKLRMTSKQFLIICRRAPYGESYAREALDVAMAAAAFDQRIAMLFLGDGVTQLFKRQDSAALTQKSLEKQLSALPLYDVNELLRR